MSSYTTDDNNIRFLSDKNIVHELEGITTENAIPSLNIVQGLSDEVLALSGKVYNAENTIDRKWKFTGGVEVDSLTASNISASVAEFNAANVEADRLYADYSELSSAKLTSLTAAGISIETSAVATVQYADSLCSHLDGKIGSLSSELTSISSEFRTDIDDLSGYSEKIRGDVDAISNNNFAFSGIKDFLSGLSSNGITAYNNVKIENRTYDPDNAQYLSNVAVADFNENDITFHIQTKVESNISVDGHITNEVEATISSHVTNKAYVDAQYGELHNILTNDISSSIENLSGTLIEKIDQVSGIVVNQLTKTDETLSNVISGLSNDVYHNEISVSGKKTFVDGISSTTINANQLTSYEVSVANLTGEIANIEVEQMVIDEVSAGVLSSGKIIANEISIGNDKVATKDYVDTTVNEKVSNTYRFAGTWHNTVETLSDAIVNLMDSSVDLSPSTGNNGGLDIFKSQLVTGTVWNVENATFEGLNGSISVVNKNYAYVSCNDASCPYNFHLDDIGGIINSTAYYRKDEVDEQISKTENILLSTSNELNKKFDSANVLTGDADPEQNKVPSYNSKNTIKVNNPQDGTDATNKQYVDQEVGKVKENALSAIAYANNTTINRVITEQFSSKGGNAPIQGEWEFTTTTTFDMGIDAKGRSSLSTTNVSDTFTVNNNDIIIDTESAEFNILAEFNNGININDITAKNISAEWLSAHAQYVDSISAESLSVAEEGNVMIGGSTLSATIDSHIDEKISTLDVTINTENTGIVLSVNQEDGKLKWLSVDATSLSTHFNELIDESITNISNEVSTSYIKTSGGVVDNLSVNYLSAKQSDISSANVSASAIDVDYVNIDEAEVHLCTLSVEEFKIDQLSVKNFDSMYVNGNTMAAYAQAAFDCIKIDNEVTLNSVVTALSTLLISLGANETINI